MSKVLLVLVLIASISVLPGTFPLVNAAISDGIVDSFQKISDTQGNFLHELDDHDWFGKSVASIGDLDGDGIVDLAVGTFLDDDGGKDRGAVWILFLNSDGTVKEHQKISDTEGGFEGILEDGIRFGHGVNSIGDLDVDGVVDLVVGSEFGRGAVWILFLNSDGTVKEHQKISDTEGGFEGILDDDDHFGLSVDGMGDLDNDGIPDLVVGSAKDDDGGFNRGSVWILFMNSDGTVKEHQKISDTEGGFEGILEDDDRFGHNVVSLDDHNGDGVVDLFVSAFLDDDGGMNRGAVWILFLNQIFLPEDNPGHDQNVLVGGIPLTIDTTALMIAGVQTSAIWMLPVLAGAAGATALYLKIRKN